MSAIARCAGPALAAATLGAQTPVLLEGPIQGVSPAGRQVVVSSFGFPIVPSSVPVGGSLAAEGWFAAGTCHAFAIETTAAATLLSNAPQLAPTRAQAREHTPDDQKGDDVEVRGSVTMLHAAPARRPRTSPSTGSTTARRRCSARRRRRATASIPSSRRSACN